MGCPSTLISNPFTCQELWQRFWWAIAAATSTQEEEAKCSFVLRRVYHRFKNSHRQQRAAVILQENWATVSERLGGLLSGDMVKASQSSVHGVGVFAARDLSEGELIALHPVDRVLQQIGGGRVAGALADEDDAAYFRPAADAQPPVSAEELAYRQVAYRKIYSHVNPQRPDSFLLDANPTKPDATGWLGHRINDGAYLSPGADEDAIPPVLRGERQGAKRVLRGSLRATARIRHDAAGGGRR